MPPRQPHVTSTCHYAQANEPLMPRVLLFASTTGYQTQGFQQAARQLGAELTVATDRCEQLDDPWRDGAIRVAFDEPARAAAHLLDVLSGAAVDGVLAVGDRPARLAAHVAEELGLRWHTAAGVAAAYDKREARSLVQSAGLPAPWFTSWDLDRDYSADGPARHVRFPCVVKPATLSASRGVMRVDTPQELDSRAGIDFAACSGHPISSAWGSEGSDESSSKDSFRDVSSRWKG